MSASLASPALQEFERWNDLPEEMKLECMKYICFRTQCFLRATARTEKRLVDSMRKVVELLVFKKKSIFLRESIRTTSFHVRIDNTPRREIDDRILPPLAHVLNTYHVKQLYFENSGLFNGRTGNKLGELIGSRPISVDMLNFPFRNNTPERFDTAMFFLKNGWNEFLEVRMLFRNSKKSLDEFFSYIPKIKRQIKLIGMKEKYIIPTFEKFAQMDVNLGVNLDVWRDSVSISIRNLADHFAHQTTLVSFENDILRIKTTNLAKHVLITNTMEYCFSGVIVPSNMETSRCMAESFNYH